MAHKKKQTDNLEPQERLKQLIQYSSLVEVDPNVPAINYYRSGFEIVRMANVYSKEGSYENAYVLHLKFIKLFMEKIRKHPGYNTVSVDVKGRTEGKLREILAKSEKLKQLLLEQYQNDYNLYLEEVKQQQRQELERRLREQGKFIEKRKSLARTSVYIPTNTISYSDVCITKDPEQLRRRTTLPVHPGTGDLVSLRSGTIDDQSKFQINFHETFGVLRPLVVPVKVMILFQAMALGNTIKNIETCGILAGRLEQNELVVSHMILPQQHGTSDSSTITNEEEVFSIQDRHNLLILGWIHTHPSQMAFLSSTDLHKQYRYQFLMPEAVAIVCAPKYNNIGYFHLSSNYGLQYISVCQRSGFHPHPTDPPLFLTAAHVRIDNNAPLVVTDLRKR